MKKLYKKTWHWCPGFTKAGITFLLLFGVLQTLKAQTTYYSKASATDFTDVASWGTATDGTGSSPASISNADNFIIQNASAMTLPGNASVRQLTINAGSLTVAANTLTVSKVGTFDSTLNVATGGTFTVSGGNVNVNGNIIIAATFNQSGGVITVDGNNGGSTTGSVASGTSLVSFTSNLLNLTGGTILIVDPNANSSGNAFDYNNGTAYNMPVGSTHTFQFGDGVSTDATANTNGFYHSTYTGSARFMFQNLTVNTVGTGNRALVKANYTHGINGNLTITSGDYSPGTIYYVAGNIVNNGILTTTSTMSFQTFVSGIVGPVSTAQTISGSGVFRNSATTQTANYSSVLVNNTSASGVTFSDANTLLNGTSTGTVSGTLTFTNGIVNIGSNTFILGISGTSVGTLSYTAGGFASGSTFSRWFGVVGTGTTITASANPTPGAGSFPFVTGVAGAFNANHFHKATAALTAAGQMAVKFTAASGVSAITPVVESALTFDKQTNSNWEVTTSAGYTSAAVHSFAVAAQGSYAATTANARLLIGSALVGTHQAGTNLPLGQRTAVPAASIVGIYTIGLVGAELPISTIASGKWEDNAIWSTGVVPTCTDLIAVSSGNTVTLDATTGTANAASIINNGTLNVATGSTLNVGCTNKNNYLNNNSVLSVSGTLNVNGNINNAASSAFNQSAGSIVIDGNSGTVGTSVLTGTPLLWLQSNNVNLTGGKITFVSGHIGSATADRVLTYTPSATPYPNVTTAHTIQFGDGVSTIANNTKGFETSLATRFYFGNVIVNTLASVNAFVASSTTTVIINGDLTVTAGEYRGGTTTQIVGGNIVNNATLTSTGTTVFGQVTQANISSPTVTAQTVAQSVAGSGVFRNSLTVPTANFTGMTINNSSATGVTFSNANSLLSGANTGTASGTLTMTTGFVNTGANTFILGTTAASNGTLSYTAGGFTSGSTFARWFPTTTGGATITAGSTPSGTSVGVYPFAAGTSTAFIARNLYLNQTAAATTGGKIAVQYNDAVGNSTVSIVDGAYNVDSRTNANWAVSQSGITGTPTYSMAINGLNIYTAVNGNSRITLASAPAFGTHQNGTTYISGQRTVLPLANLSDTYYLGISSSDIPFVSIANGDWNSAATWNKASVPTCTDVAQIAAGNTVTVNSASNSIKNITIASTGTLAIASGDLTVGCTLNNNILSNNGTLTVSGGVLNVNGSINVPATAFISQSGGVINVDGNAAGVAASSVASGTNLVSILAPSTNVSFTGGIFNIVDPAVNVGQYALYVSNSSATAINCSNSHTFQFGDGTSTDLGSTDGFYVNLWVVSTNLAFGNLVINGASSSTNSSTRYFKSNYTPVVRGDLTINSNGEYRQATTHLAGNLLVNTGGVFTNTSSLILDNYDLQAGTATPVTTAQTIGGVGVFRNLTTVPTANLTSFTVNNSNATGVTLNVPLSVSGTLTLTSGKVNTSSANLLTLGTATAAGTLSGGSTTAYITGPFARTIASGNANTSYIVYPVGKTSYAPISLAPATTAVSNMTAEAFDSNSGTGSSNISNLSAAKRWEAPFVSGAFSTINVRVGDNAITSANFPVIAPTASGVYDSLFGTTGTYAAGTPNTTTSTTALAFVTGNYTGFLSYAEISSTLGTSELGSLGKGINIYPNPFTDVVYISEVKDVVSVSIVDISGRIVKTVKPARELQLGDLKSGLYLINLTMKDGSVKTVKSIKK